MTVPDPLRRLVEAAPPGTLVPIEALGEPLAAEGTAVSPLSEPTMDHTAADVAKMLDRTPAAVRAWCAAGRFRVFIDFRGIHLTGPNDRCGATAGGRGVAPGLADGLGCSAAPPIDCRGLGWR